MDANRLRRSYLLSFLALAASIAAGPLACEDESSSPPSATGFEAGGFEGGTPLADAFVPELDADAPDTSPPADAADAADAADGGLVYSCGAFLEATTWTVAPGFRAVVVAKDNGLNQPVAITFAGGAFGGKLYVVNQGDRVLRTVDTITGAVASFTAGAAWGARTPVDLTSITWDAENVFDGALYVGDEGSTGDQDSAIYRVTAAGVGSTFTMAPGPGLDDVFSLAFAPKAGAYPQGLYVSGDTDGALVDFGIFATNGTGVPFSEVAGAEGIVFANIPGFGGTLLASRPNGGGYAGEDEISRIKTDGTKDTALATGLMGVHAVTYSPGGVFGQNVYVASWQTGTLNRVDAAGTVTEIASGLSLTNFDGNILAISPDGRTMMVADRGANRIVCIEATN